MKCGDVCLADYPFTDFSAAKLRPVLIISADRFNGGNDLIVVPISSSPSPDDPYSIVLPSTSPEFHRSGLRYNSAIKWTKPITIFTSVLSRRLGSVSKAFVQQVQSAVKEVLS
jgi:mRNA interferase MazF